MISVIIPTHNGQSTLRLLLNSLHEQSVLADEIIIIDSESIDSTLEIATDANCRVSAIHKKDFDHGTARNIGVRQAKGEFIVFLTQDAISADEFLIEQLIKPMQSDPNIAICYGRQIPFHDANPIEAFSRGFNYPPQSIRKTKEDINTLGLKAFFCSNSCSAIRLSIFRKLGGFKNNVIVNEDMLFAAKAILDGYSVYYAAEAKVYHSHNYSLPQIFKRYFKIGRFFADNKSIFSNVGLKGYGKSMLKAAMKKFWSQGKPFYIIAFLMEFIIKAVACKLGWYYQRLFYQKNDTYL